MHDEEKGSAIAIYAKCMGTKEGLDMSVQPMNTGAAGGADEDNQPLFVPLKMGVLLCQEKLSMWTTTAEKGLAVFNGHGSWRGGVHSPE